MTILNVVNQLLAYDDATESNNPNLKPFDWSRKIYSIPLTNASSDVKKIAPNESVVLFNGTKSSGISGTSVSLSIVDLANSVYRLTSSGSNVFRTARAIDTNSSTTCTVSTNNNAIAEFNFSNGTFTSVQEGDEMLIKAGGVFGELNAGIWIVVAVAGNIVSAVRPTGEDFMYGALTTPVFGAGFADELMIYSAAGIRAGDKMSIEGALSSVSRRVYQIKSATPKYVEFVSGVPLPSQSGVAVGASDIIFYSNAKKILYIEADQDAIVQLNGETSESNRLTPQKNGDSTAPAYLHKFGDTWSCTVINRSVNQMSVVWFSGE